MPNHLCKLFFSLFSVFLFSSITLLAQSEPASFYATTNTKEVTVGNTFRISFILENADGLDFQPPAFKEFAVVGSRGQSTSMSIINGKMSRSISYNYTLQAKKSGAFVIEPASVIVNGKTLFTKPIEINVLKAPPPITFNKKNKPLSANEDLFVRAEISSERTFIGAQLILEYKLYTAIEVQNYSLINESAYPGFFVQYIRNFDSASAIERIGNKQFVTKTLKRVALFPQIQDTLFIDPFLLSVGIGSRQGFFSIQPERYVNISSNPLKIIVDNPPMNTSGSISGVVGHCNHRLIQLNDSVQTGEGGKLQIEVSGDGDLKRIQAPAITFPLSFEIYGPKISEEKSMEYGGAILNKRVFEWIFVPSKPGKHLIDISYSCLQTDSNTYLAVAPDSSFVVTVTKGLNSQTDNDTSLNEKYLVYDSKGLAHIKNLKPFSDYSLFLLILLPLLLLLVAWMINRIKNKTVTVNLNVKETQSETLETLLKSNDNSFFESLKRQLWQLADAKTGKNSAVMEKKELQQLLQQHVPSKEAIQKFFYLLSQCELALYSGINVQGKKNELYKEWHLLLRKWE